MKIEKTRLAVGFIFMLWMLHTALPILNHDHFCSTGMDLGIFTQRAWRLAHGDLYMCDTIHEPACQFRDHFTPLMLLMGPVMYIFNFADVFIALQSLSILTASAFLFMICIKRGMNLFSSTLVTTAFLLHPFFLHMSLFDFHPMVIAPAFIFYAVLNSENEKKVIFSLIGMCMLKEIMIPISLAVIFYLWKKEKVFYKDSIYVPIAALAIWVLLFTASPGGDYKYVDRIGNPFEFLLPKTLLLASIIVPLGIFIPSWAIVIGGFELMLNMITVEPNQLIIVHHYHATVVTAFILAIVDNWNDRFKYLMIPGMIIGLIIWSPFGILHPNKCIMAGNIDMDAIRYLENIPPDVRVCTENHLMPHTATRWTIHYVNETNDDCDLIIVDNQSPWYFSTHNQTAHDNVIEQLEGTPIRSFGTIEVYEKNG